MRPSSKSAAYCESRDIAKQQAQNCHISFASQRRARDDSCRFVKPTIWAHIAGYSSEFSIEGLATGFDSGADRYSLHRQQAISLTEQASIEITGTSLGKKRDNQVAKLSEAT
jgi:hypothetical protein